MACLTSAQRARLQARLAIIQDHIAKAEESFGKALESMDVEEYRFNSGEGSQMARQADIKKLNDVLESLYAQEDSVIRKLEGRGIVNMNLRRKRYNTYGRGSYGTR